MCRCARCTALFAPTPQLLAPDLCAACWERARLALIARMLDAESPAVATAELLTGLRALGVPVR